MKFYFRKKNCFLFFLTLIVLISIPFSVFADWIDLRNNLILDEEINQDPSRLVPKIELLDLNERQAYDSSSMVEQNKKIKITLEQEGIGLEEKIVRKKTFHKLFIPSFEYQGQVGKPALPIKLIFIPIAPQINASITHMEKQVSHFELNLYPTQPAQPESIDRPMPFTLDKRFYKQDKLFPESNVIHTEYVQIRDKNYFVITLTPVQVNAMRKDVQIARKMEIEVTLKMSRTLTPAMEKRAEFQSLSRALTAPQKYMIIADDQFSNNAKLKEFMDWKTKKGYKVQLVRTSQIPSSTYGAPTANEIINYMRGLSSANYPKYLLMLGTHDAKNGVAAKYVKTRYGGYSDLYAACRTSSDYLPDLHYGRLPASNNSQLTTMLNKVLLADRNPPNSNMYDKILVAGQIQDSNHDNVADRYFCETADLIMTYFQKNNNYNYKVTEAIVNPHGVDPNCKWRSSSILWRGASSYWSKIGTRVHSRFVSVSTARSRIFNDVNSGLTLVQHRDHGGVTGWGDPKFNSYDVNNLHNGNNRPLVLSVNCLTGAYHKSNNFTKAWLTHSNGGAYAVFSAVDVSYSGYNDYFTHGMYLGLIPDYRTFQINSTDPNWAVNLPYPSAFSIGNQKKLGEMMNAGKAYMYQRYGSGNSICKKTYELFHVFGDPEAPVLLHKPRSISRISYPAAVQTGKTSITINAEEDGSQICLYSKELNIHQVLTGKEVTFNINSQKPGRIQLTITKAGREPFESSIVIK